MIKKLFLLAAAIAAAATLTACGGGGGGTLPDVATQNLSVPIDATNGTSVAAAIASQSFDFSTGISDFGTTADTTVTLTNGGTNFQVASGGKTASGTMSFGSCHFNVTSTTFTSGPLGTLQTITFNICTLTGFTSGFATVPSLQLVPFTLTLNSFISNRLNFYTGVYPGGIIQLNGITLGTVPTAPPSGA
jgi:predicted small lipoprotein YifL